MNVQVNNSTKSLSPLVVPSLQGIKVSSLSLTLSLFNITYICTGLQSESERREEEEEEEKVPD